MKEVVISLFDHTGNMVRPWAESGYECWCVDLQNDSARTEKNIRYIRSDIMLWSIPAETKAIIMFAFPPCTDLAVSGARWWRGKGLSALSKAIGLVGRAAELCNDSGAPWMLENPIGCLSSHWRKPDAQFDP